MSLHTISMVTMPSGKIVKEQKILCTDNERVNWEFDETAQANHTHIILYDLAIPCVGISPIDMHV